jgi:hypothetical protein
MFPKLEGEEVELINCRLTWETADWSFSSSSWGFLQGHSGGTEDGRERRCGSKQTRFPVNRVNSIFGFTLVYSFKRFIDI